MSTESDKATDEFRREMESEGYVDVRQVLKGPLIGKWIGLRKFMFTTGVVVGMDATGYMFRYCYDSITDAKAGLLAIEKGEKPVDYIVKKG